MQPASFSATIIAVEPAAVAAFYRTHFDLEETMNLGWFVSLRRADADWELCVWDSAHESVPPGIRPGSGVVLAFITDDATAAAKRLEDAGVPIVAPLVDEPWGQRHVYVHDPADTLVDVVEFTTPDPAWLAANGLG